VDNNDKIVVTGRDSGNDLINVRRYANDLQSFDWSTTEDPHATKEDRGWTIAVDSSNNIIIAGHQGAVGSEDNDWYVKKILPGASGAGGAAGYGGFQGYQGLPPILNAVILFLLIYYWEKGKKKTKKRYKRRRPKTFSKLSMPRLSIPKKRKRNKLFKKITGR
jgi:hypothetical protein